MRATGAATRKLAPTALHFAVVLAACLAAGASCSTSPARPNAAAPTRHATPANASAPAHHTVQEPPEHHPVTKPHDTTRPASIGQATMQSDGTIVMDLRATGPNGALGDGRVVYHPFDPHYQEVLHHLGGMTPGQTKPVPPWE